MTEKEPFYLGFIKHDLIADEDTMPLGYGDTPSKAAGEAFKRFAKLDVAKSKDSAMAIYNYGLTAQNRSHLSEEARENIRRAIDAA